MMNGQIHILLKQEIFFISYCMRNEGQAIEHQINGAFDVLHERLETIGLTLDSVVKMDCLFKDIMDLLYLGEIIKERFHGIILQERRLKQDSSGKEFVFRLMQ